MRYALVDNAGAILRRAEFDATPPTLSPQKGLRWWLDSPPAYDSTTQSPPVAVTPVVGGAVQYVVNAIPLTEAQALLKARVSTERKRRELGGATIGGRMIPTDMETRALIQELTERVRDGATSVNFQRADGTWVTLTAAQFVTLARAVRAYIQACRAAERAHHDAIDALTSPAAAAYDTTTGWPA